MGTFGAQYAQPLALVVWELVGEVHDDFCQSPASFFLQAKLRKITHNIKLQIQRRMHCIKILEQECLKIKINSNNLYVILNFGTPLTRVQICVTTASTHSGRDSRSLTDLCGR